MWRTIDLVLRIIYLIAAPAILVISAAVTPILGLAISAGLATIIAMFGADRWRRLVGRIPVVGGGLAKMNRLGEFYAEHPPKPLVYYLFYPLLLPVILFLRIPRRELLLYRRLGIVAIAILIVVPLIDYLRHWRPDLPFGLFLATIIVGFLFQLAAIFVLLMPIVTTFVTLRSRGLYKTMALVVILATLSGIAGYAGVRKSHQMPMSRWTRIQIRTAMTMQKFAACVAEHPDRKPCVEQKLGSVPLELAVNAAAQALVNDKQTLDVAEDKAHEQLEALYLPDEANEFRVYMGDGCVVVYVQYARKDVLWVGRNKAGFFHDNATLPAALRKQFHLD